MCARRERVPCPVAALGGAERSARTASTSSKPAPAAPTEGISGLNASYSSKALVARSSGRKTSRAPSWPVPGSAPPLATTPVARAPRVTFTILRSAHIAMLRRAA